VLGISRKDKRLGVEETVIGGAIKRDGSRRIVTMSQLNIRANTGISDMGGTGMEAQLRHRAVRRDNGGRNLQGEIAVHKGIAKAILYFEKTPMSRQVRYIIGNTKDNLIAKHATEPKCRTKIGCRGIRATIHMSSTTDIGIKTADLPIHGRSTA
jgi:hypothetical protein